jgi:hypothetical protein
MQDLSAADKAGKEYWDSVWTREPKRKSFVRRSGGTKNFL